MFRAEGGGGGGNLGIAVLMFTCNNWGLSAKTTDSFSTVTGPIFVSPPVNTSSQGIENTRTAIAVKT